MNISQADRTAAEITAALNALAIRGTHDQDIAAAADEGHYFWEAPIGNGRHLFACLWVANGEGGFTVDVRRDSDRDIDERSGELATGEMTAAAITGLIATAHALATRGLPIA